MIATKALACKLAKAAWHVMAEGTDYQAARMFPEWAAKNLGEQAAARNGVGEKL